ncbi:hypothetical protein [Kocuria sp. ICS0012]|uniref:hypothetical protein n=1 Tax=Kocuria sp. ICS0012 TaxID=1834155 RepID=UPI000B253F3D|nr:hypothetical protein [Kocuria sp. ICS0012]
MPPIQQVSLTEIDHLNFASETRDDPRCRLDVDVDGLSIPLLVVPRQGAQRVAILSNGAVDQALANRQAVFQRSSWYNEISHHQIYVSDPATGAPDFLSLAWGHVTEEHWAVEAIGRAVKAVAARLGVVDCRQRVYFGSSAGGFMSLALLAEDPGARAVVNNAQFDWTRWMPTGVNALRHARFGSKLPAAIRELHPLTSNVLSLLVHKNHPVTIDYHVNVASVHDHQQDLPLFEAFVRDHPELCGDVRIHKYAHFAHGHNPMPKPDTLRIINHAFDMPVHLVDTKSAPADEGHGWPVIRLISKENVTEHLAAGNTPLRYDVDTETPGQEPLQAILTDTPGADTLVVVFHGLVDRRKYNLPRFERFSALHNLPHHMLFVSDPTLASRPLLRIGWYIGTEEDAVPERLASHITSVADALNVKKILLVGSCGGGFTALALAPRIHGALALAFSPDVRAADYAGGGPMAALVSAAFPSLSSAAELQQNTPSMVDLMALYDTTSTGAAWYIQNSGDELYVGTAMEPFRDHVDHRVRFVLEHHCRGHNPPTPARVRAWISAAAKDPDTEPQQLGRGVNPRRTA